MNNDVTSTLSRHKLVQNPPRANAPSQLSIIRIYNTPLGAIERCFLNNQYFGTLRGSKASVKWELQYRLTL
jgi:hypothetical protein